MFIMAVSSYLLTPLIYLFIHPEASVRWFCFEKLQENSCGGLRLQTPAHVFSCEFCEINKMYFVEKLRTTASEHRIYILLIFVLILRQNRYLPLNSDHLLGKHGTMLRSRSQPSKISYLRFGFFIFYLYLWPIFIGLSIATRFGWYKNRQPRCCQEGGRTRRKVKIPKLQR